MATGWTNNPLQADVTRIRKIHINELRTAVNNNINARGGIQRTWSEDIQADVTRVRNLHLNELRESINYLTTIISPCTTNTVPKPPTWTSPNPMTSDSVNIRAVHIQELRELTNDCENACYCDCHGHCSCVSHSHCSCAGMAHCCCQSHGGTSSIRYKTNIKLWI